MIPSYIRLKYEAKCSACNETIQENSLAFYNNTSGRTGCAWHSKCGDKSWKIEGSPYDIRIKAAIAHKEAKEPIKNKIKLILRRFRKELVIQVTKIQLEPEIYVYFKKHHLIEFDEKRFTYSIIPKGFNWDVDLEVVRMPLHNENIMERDQELENIP